MVDATGATVDNEAELVAASAAVLVSASEQLFGRLRAGSHGRRQGSRSSSHATEASPKPPESFNKLARLLVADPRCPRIESGAGARNRLGFRLIGSPVVPQGEEIKKEPLCAQAANVSHHQDRSGAVVREGEIGPRGRPTRSS